MIDRRLLLSLAAAAALAAPSAAPAAEPLLGQPAPAFEAKDYNGQTRSLAEFRGKTVVLEWTNNGCPYVGKHYGAGNMQRIQKEATAQGVEWLTIISSAPGFQGYLTPPEAKAWKAKVGAHSSDVLLDPEGTVGRLYEAKATPHMFIIDKAGTLVYMGGIDDRPYSDPASLKGATNYVEAALADIKAGRPVATPATRPYGCAVKYSSAE
ncbi:MAG: redoxin domain-containing protein [Phenylobacterium sp.]|uniref:thioredoxin family protein n=1 Tax=Phenylobacterium sp. TaxID=1871053 RepID=UPI0025CDFE17|nr:thioredoxin family protein [Phenylobacterium sp.]MBI1200598.1 redoxin domain-containing protein [Phenylobacterium sp.]